MKHKNIIGIVDSGFDGQIYKQSGKTYNNLVYIIMEYVSGGILFDLCQSRGAMGEETGKFFFNQMIDVLGYM